MGRPATGNHLGVLRMYTVDDQRREWYRIPLWSSFLTTEGLGREFGRFLRSRIEIACSLEFRSDDAMGTLEHGKLREVICLINHAKAHFAAPRCAC